GLDEPEREAPQDREIVSIEITGQRPGVLRRLMEDFIIEVGQPVSSRGYARWRDRLCVGVFNMPDTMIAHYIADIISFIAQETGIETGVSGCTPKSSILFSPDAGELATKLAAESPRLSLP